MAVTVVVAAALTAATSGAAPTGLAAADLVDVAAAAAVVTWAGSRARRWTWLVPPLVGVWFASSPLALAGLALSALVALHALLTRRRRAAGALAAGASALALGALDPVSPLGASTLVALVAVTPLVVSALVHSRPRVTRRAVRTAGVAALVVVGAGAVAAVVVALSLGDLRRGAEAARDGFDLAADGEQGPAAAAFSAGAEAFDRVRGRLAGPWMLPARLVPVLGQHVRAAQVATAEGAALAEVAADTVARVDPDAIRLDDGRVDLDTIDALAPVLSRLETTVARAAERLDGARSPWLVPALDERLAIIADRLDGAVPAAHTAAEAARVAPVLFGADEPAHWLVLLVTPAEARGLGGLVGNYVLVEADDGAVRLVESGRNEDLDRRLAEVGAVLEGPDDYVAWWGRFRPERFFEDVTFSPDLPSVAAVAASLVTQATGTPVDGVVLVDPFAVAAVLELTGPVDAAGIRLDAANVVDFLLRDQYRRFEGDEAGRVAALAALVDETLGAVLDGALPGPRLLARELGPVVAGDRLGVWWLRDARAVELLRDTGLDDAFPAAAGDDLVGVVHQNAGRNKTDNWLTRRIEYRVDSAAGTARLTVELHNGSPTSGWPDAVIGSNDQGLAPGTNRARLDLYTVRTVEAVTVDGERVPALRGHELGVGVTEIVVDVPAGATRTVTATLGPGPTELLQVAAQPLVNPDHLTVVVDGETVHDAVLD
ncbi:MAG: DUF4012 domain-containing protein, partial [Actinomyces sp.]